jgi:hypothetical protein
MILKEQDTTYTDVTWRNTLSPQEYKQSEQYKDRKTPDLTSFPFLLPEKERWEDKNQDGH